LKKNQGFFGAIFQPCYLSNNWTSCWLLAAVMSTRRLPKDWRRPRHTWLQTLSADLHPLNHGLNSAWRLAQDRERWRQLVETATLQPGLARDDDHYL